MKLKEYLGSIVVLLMFFVCVNVNIVYAKNTNAFISPTLNIDKEIKKFPKNFTGDDIESIVKKLEKIDTRKLEKDKFESKQQYYKRLENVIPKINDVYSFKVEDGSGWVNSKYDADRGLMRVGIKVVRDDKVIKEKKSKGNMLDKRFIVEYDTMYDIENINSDLKCMYGVCETGIPMTPEYASENRKYIKAIIICNIIPMYEFGGFVKDEYNGRISIWVRPIGVWFYNESTGEIYKKINYGN